MENVKYTYALNEDNSIVTINVAIKGEAYFCPHCKAIMIVKDGGIKIKHFAHKERNPSCSYESYLHSLAKKRIEEWFNSDRPILISLKNKLKCHIFDECIWSKSGSFSCEKNVYSSYHSLKQYYSKITPDGIYKGVQTNLLVSSNLGVNEPIFIEICMNHSRRAEMANSKIRVIDISINTESELESIINSGLLQEGTKILFHNFKRKTEVSNKIEGEQLCKFVLYESMRKAELIYQIHCKAFAQRHSYALLEITFNSKDPVFSSISPFIFGWAVTNHLLSNVRNCILCKHYFPNRRFVNSFCSLHKTLNVDNSDGTDRAMECNEYQIDDIIEKTYIPKIRYVAYNIWKKGMDDKGIDYKKEKVAE